MRVTREHISGEQRHAAFEAACHAFWKGPPGVVRSVVLHDSAPPYEPLASTHRDQREAIADVCNAFVGERDA